ncbi:hypothetical protein ACFL6U_29245 [Planctomycetota bacterium]
MMKCTMSMVACLLLCSSLYADSEHLGDAFSDEGLGITFPTILGGLAYRDMQDYGDPALGYSLRYQSSFTPIKADVYVYDRGIIGIPTGYDNEAVLTEGDITKAELTLLEMEGEYSQVKHIKRDVFPAEGDIQFSWDRFEFVSQRHPKAWGHCVSECYVTGLGGRFVKLRLTYQKEIYLMGEAYAQQVVTGLREVLKTSRFPHRPASPKDILQAIAQFRKDPLAMETEVATRQIIGYVQESDAVLVSMGPECCPWFADKSCRQPYVLLTAYVAGNMEPQLKEGVVEDHAYAGVLQVIETYKQLRQQEQLDTVPSIDQWIDLEQVGKLETFLEVEADRQTTQVAKGSV